MKYETKLNDVSDELLIFNKITIDRLFSLKNGADCVALYSFYYKTAKWQKTNKIHATDEYIKKSLKWGVDKIRNTKATLKENGLIDVIQSRKDGKIDGWYIQVNYIVTQKKQDDINIKVEESNNSQNPQIEKSTNGDEKINALREQIKCLKKEIEMLKNENIKKADPDQINALIEYLNEKAKTSYRAKSKSTQQHIKARLNEGFTIDDFKKVIDNKCAEWLGTEFEKYLRPETLFGTKFESYLNAKNNQSRRSHSAEGSFETDEFFRRAVEKGLKKS